MAGLIACDIAGQGRRACLSLCVVTSEGHTLCGSEPGELRPLPNDPGFASIHSGGSHTCGLTPGGEAYCWGANDSGQLGNGVASPTPASAPVRVATELRFVGLDAGVSSTCATTEAGSVHCWGSNGMLQLGFPNDPSSGCESRIDRVTGRTVDFACSVPRPVATDLRFRQVRTGNRFTCGLALQGDTYCWGWNAHRVLGVAHVTHSVCRSGFSVDCTPVPTRASGGMKFDLLARVAGFTPCGVTAEGAAYCWGAVRVGDPLFSPVPDAGSPTPVRLPEPARIPNWK